MLNKKFLASILLVLAVLLAQVNNVAAAPPPQEVTPPEITQIETETDESGVTTVLVTLLAEDQTTQTVRISLEYALLLGLIDPATQQPVAPEDVPEGTTIEPAEVIEELPVEEPTEPEAHLISQLLASFFFPDDESMVSVIDSFHTGDNSANQVFGFGVIAQALWMSRDSDGMANAEFAEEILLAKQSKNFEEFFSEHPEYLPENGTAPTNWGQFKKTLNENKDKHNLGVIVSEQADQAAEEESLNQQEHGNGQDQENGQGKGKDNGKGKGKDKKNKNP